MNDRIPTRRRAAALAAVVALLAMPSAASDTPRETVEAFGHALVAADGDALRALFPSAGKVRVKLIRLGDHEGALSSGQLAAVLQDFFDRGSVRDFSVESVEATAKLALAGATVDVVDASGSRSSFRLHLAFEPEGSRWVLRELRESRR